MNDKSLISYSHKIHDQARQLIEKTKVINTLSKFGQVEVTGSYPMDLMFDPDIDIVVVADKPRFSSLKALNTLIKQRKFQKYYYGDFVAFKRKNRPHGYIINLLRLYGGKKWEFEIWFLKSAEGEKKFLKDMLTRLDDEKRLTILRIKQERTIGGLSKKSLSSFEIYDWVLNKGAKELSDISINKQA